MSTYTPFNVDKFNLFLLKHIYYWKDSDERLASLHCVAHFGSRVQVIRRSTSKPFENCLFILADFNSDLFCSFLVPQSFLYAPEICLFLLPELYSFFFFFLPAKPAHLSKEIFLFVLNISPQPTLSTVRNLDPAILPRWNRAWIIGQRQVCCDISDGNEWHHCRPTLNYTFSWNVAAVTSRAEAAGDHRLWLRLDSLDMQCACCHIQLLCWPNTSIFTIVITTLPSMPHPWMVVGLGVSPWGFCFFCLFGSSL